MSRLGQTWADLQPCGTSAAYTRHRRKGEPACYACLQAEARLRQDRKGSEYIGPSVPDPRPVLNGLPDMPPLPPPEPPVLRAHESMSMSQTALLEGLAALHAKEWGP